MKHLIGVRYSRVLMLVLALIPGVLIGAHTNGTDPQMTSLATSNAAHRTE